MNSNLINEAEIEHSVARRVFDIREMARITGLAETTVRTYASAKRYQHLLPRGFKRPRGLRWIWWADEVETWVASGMPPQPRRKAPMGRPTKAEQLRRRQKGAKNG